MNKRIALCIANHASKTKYGADAYKVGYSHLKEAILDSNENVDVFIYSVEPHLEDELVELYKPVSYVFETEKNFQEEWKNLNPNYHGGHATAINYQRLFAMMYDRYAVNELKSEYEKKHNFKYDWVIFVRPDISVRKGVYLIERIFFDKDLDNSKIYMAMYEQVRIGPMDVWFYSNSKNMDIISSLYKHLVEYLTGDYVDSCLKEWIDDDLIWESKEFSEKLTFPKNMVVNGHRLYKWHLYVNNLWSSEHIRFVNTRNKIDNEYNFQLSFKEEPNKIIINEKNFI